MSGKLKMMHQGRIKNIDIAEIRPSPWQPRRFFNEEELIGLAQSIASQGILQPLSVRRVNGEWQLIAGERRLRAAKIAGLKQVPCIEISADEEQAAMLTLIENMQRQDLNYFEEAEAIAQLMEEWELTQQAMAAKLGKSQSAIANKVRLLRLSPNLRTRILQAQLTERHSRALLRLPAEEREGMLTKFIEQKMNVEQAENSVNAQMEPPKPKQTIKPLVKDVRIFINTFANAVDIMRKNGIAAESFKQETDQHIEYTVRIPKAAAHRAAESA